MSAKTGRSLALILLFLTCSATQEALSDDAKLLRSIEDIQVIVADIRQRPFTHSFEKGIRTKEQIGQYLKKTFETEFAPMERLYSLVYAEFALIPSDMDLRKVMVSLLTSQIGGYYAPEEKAFYVSRNFTAFSNVIVAHELTHALQDCYVPLERLLYLEDLGFTRHTSVRNDDIYLARLALIEGEAQYVTSLYMARQGSFFNRDALTASACGNLVASQLQLSATPQAIVDQLMFPYTKGLKFVLTVFQVDGWQSIDRAYERLPCSTEQIIHPEKYVLNETPVFVEARALDQLEQSGWQRKMVNCMGEFMCDEVVKTMTGCFVKGIRASCGWGGDMFTVFCKGQEVLIVWYTVWDTEPDAQEFFAYFGEGLQTRASSTSEVDTSRSDHVHIRDTRTKLLAKRGKDVYYVSAYQPANIGVATSRLVEVQYLSWNDRFNAHHVRQEAKVNE